MYQLNPGCIPLELRSGLSFYIPSSFFGSMPKPVLPIEEQIALLQSRGMKFRDSEAAKHYLLNISYYRLKGYWWDRQLDKVSHQFHPDIIFH